MKLVDFILVMLSISFVCLGLGLVIQFPFYGSVKILICSAVFGGLAVGTGAAAFFRSIIAHEEADMDICFLFFLPALGSIILGASLGMML